MGRCGHSATNYLPTPRGKRPKNDLIVHVDPFYVRMGADIEENSNHSWLMLEPELWESSATLSLMATGVQIVKDADTRHTPSAYRKIKEHACFV